MTAPETQKTIDTYLAALRKQLRELMEEDATDIVDEIRAHILDKTSNGCSPEKVSATLAALGTPEELASRYRTEELLRRAQLTRSPLVSLRSLLHWATLSFTGIVVFIVSVFGYALEARSSSSPCSKRSTREAVDCGRPPLPTAHGDSICRSRAERPRRARNFSDGGCCPLGCFSARGCCS
jgi:hypothetical protein